MSKVADYQQNIQDAIEHIKPGRIEAIGTKLDGERYIIMELPVRLRDTVLTALRAQLETGKTDWQQMYRRKEVEREGTQNALDDARLTIRELRKELEDYVENSLSEESREICSGVSKMAEEAPEKVAQLEPGWIKVSPESMPEHDQTVLLVVERYCEYLKKTARRVIRGCHIEDGKLDVNGWDDYEDATYSEADDCYYAKEGWFEECDFLDEYSYLHIDDDWTVTHWMPLPEPPRDDLLPSESTQSGAIRQARGDDEK